jgi:hypothetical protein
MRLIRILVYEGGPGALQDVLQQRSVKGSYRIGNKVLIREAILGDFLEAFDHPEPEPKASFEGDPNA